MCLRIGINHRCLVIVNKVVGQLESLKLLFLKNPEVAYTWQQQH